jgi:hypothetical protein
MENETCETCEGSGYIWRKGPDGKSWMCDCDDDNCNAFGQMDEPSDDATE